MADNKDRFDYFCEGIHEAADEFDGFDENQHSLTLIVMNRQTHALNSFALGTDEMAVLAFATQMYLDAGFAHIIKESYALMKQWKQKDRQDLEDAIRSHANPTV